MEKKVKIKMFPLTGNTRIELTSGNVVIYNGEYSSEREPSDDDYLELDQINSSLLEGFKKFFVEVIEPSLPKPKWPYEVVIKFRRGDSYFDRHLDEYVHDEGHY